MLNMECELCEIDGEIELCDGTFIELDSDMLPKPTKGTVVDKAPLSI